MNINIYSASNLNYKVTNPTPVHYFNRDAFTQIVVMFYVFGLLFFTVFQFFVFNGRMQLMHPKYISLVFITFGVSFACNLNTLCYLLLTIKDFYWFASWSQSLGHSILLLSCGCVTHHYFVLWVMLHDRIFWKRIQVRFIRFCCGLTVQIPGCHFIF